MKQQELNMLVLRHGLSVREDEEGFTIYDGSGTSKERICVFKIGHSFLPDVGPGYIEALIKCYLISKFYTIPEARPGSYLPFAKKSLLKRIFSRAKRT